MKTDIAIIGAGAAGLMAAIFAGRTSKTQGHRRIIALDGARRIGAKILISGGGRCNVTHDEVGVDAFNGSKRNQIAKILRTFDVPETVAFFRELHVELKREETGKLFPVSDRALTVLDALTSACRDAGAELLTGRKARSLSRGADGFVIETNDQSIVATSVILATGGRSVPKTGSDGSGYDLARALGHSVTKTFAALVPLVLPSSHWMTALSGVSCDVELKLSLPNGKLLRRESGSMLFTHFGISGPVALDISRHWIAERQMHDEVVLTAAFVDATFEEVEEELIGVAKSSARMHVGTLVERWLPAALALALLRDAAATDPATPLGQMSRDERRRILRALTACEIPVTRDRGLDYAEVTAGGVPLDEIHLATMESRICPGLYLCGEILDVDGKIGGYNFQWAWASGRLAGISAATGQRRTT